MTLLLPPVKPELVGRQQPRVCSHPGTAVSSAGAEVVAFAATAGLILDPWQQFVLDIMLGERADGRWAAREVAYLVARQNGKGGVLDALGLAALFLFDDEIEILHSAHEFKTAKKAYRSLKGLIQRTPHLLAQVERRGHRVVGFRQSNEDTSISLQSGAVCRFMARSNNTARGFSPQRVIADEAQELSEETRQALYYTTSAQKNPQFVLTGTVPSPKNNGEVFEALRDRGRAGGDPYLAWMEWTPEPDVDPMSDEAAIASNPGMPYRITSDTIDAERTAATTPEAIEGLCRERFSIWHGKKGGTVIDLAHWADLADPNPPKSTDHGLAIDITPDRSSGSVAYAGRRPDGRAHVEVIENKRGTGWIVDLVVARRRARPDATVMVDASGPAGSLIVDLQAAGIDSEHGLIICSGRDMGQACGAFYDAVMGTPANDLDEAIPPSLTHFNQPALNAALEAARKRPLGDAWAWHRKDTTDISPLVAVTLALAALERVPKKKKRSGKVW